MNRRAMAGLIAFAALAGLFTAGCSQYHDPNVPAPILPREEPEWGNEYLLYRPSLYDRNQAWPVFVICHGAYPDSAIAQMKAWTQSAEERGVLLVACELTSPRFSWRNDATRLQEDLREDERRILASVRHVQAGHEVSPDRIFIAGWAKGASAALYTGLRHPELFRAVAVAEPDFVAGAMSPAVANLDPHQPVLIHHSSRDALFGKTARAAGEWLQDHGVFVKVDSLGPVNKDEPGRLIDFFEDVLRRCPRIHVTAQTPEADDPLLLQLAVRSSCPLTRYRWQYDDGTSDVVAQPRRRFAGPGLYEVQLTVEDDAGESYNRRAWVTVPGGHVQYTPPSDL